MKSTETFTNTIREYLEARAKTDSLFSASFANEAKNINDCITYILNAVQKSGCQGFADAEVYSIAVHYYDEKDIKVGKPIACKVVVNHEVVLTAEEISNTRKAAKDKLLAEEMERLQKRHEAKKPKPNAEKAAFVQTSLF